MARGGKKQILVDPELAPRILALIRAGNYIETAAEAAGVTRKTLYVWLRTLPTFAADVQKATAESESHAVNLIAQAAKTQWQAAAWRLERRNPKKWGMRVQMIVQQEVDNVLDRIKGVVDAETYERILASIAGEEQGTAAPGIPALGAGADEG